MKCINVYTIPLLIFTFPTLIYFLCWAFAPNFSEFQVLQSLQGFSIAAPFAAALLGTFFWMFSEGPISSKCDHYGEVTKREQTDILGTAHFKSRSHAMNYYAQFASCKLTNIDEVQGKIDRGEIYTTEPDMSHPDAISYYPDKSGRYHIVWRRTSIK